VSEVITFTPGTLAGTEHLFDVNLQTTGDVNPLRFFAGHFDGDVDTGVLNFDGLAAWVQTPPDVINIGLDVAENALFEPEMFTSFGLEWTATSPSKVVFDYVENESAPGGNPSDYGTTLTVDQMPTMESLSLAMDEDLTMLTLSHRANAVIDQILLEKTREDGLVIRGVATDVPTEVDLTYDFDPSVTLDVNANTLDLTLEVSRAGGIPGTTGFFNYPIGYAAVRVIDAPDLTATWDADFDSFSVVTPNPGEFIGAVEVVLDDDAHYGAIVDGQVDADADGDVDADDDGLVAGHALIDGRIDVDADGDVDLADDGTVAGMAVLNGLFDVDASGLVNGGDDRAPFLVGLHTPPSYFEGLDGLPGELHHLFSLVDDGFQGTVVGRILQVDEAVLDLDPDATKTFHLVLAAPAMPMQAYLRTLPTSTIVPGHDIEITCDIDDVPFGVFDIHFDGPGNFGYTTDPPQTIDSIHCFGHIDTLNFDIDAGGLPPVFDFEFDPDSHITIFAGDGMGGPAEVGHVAARFWDADGPVGLPDTAGLLGQALRDARMRVDDIPSSHAEWTQVQVLAYDGGAGVLPAPGAILYDAATGATAEVLDVTGAAPASGTIKIGFVETGVFNDNDAFDLLELLAIDAQTEDVAVGAAIVGRTSGATAVVRRAKQIGGAGTLYLSDISGTFQDGEDLELDDLDPLVDNEVVARVDGTLQAAATWTAQVNGALTIDGTVMDFNTDAADVFLGGVQFLVSTAVELEDPLPVADLSAPHFAVLEEEFVDSVLVQRLGGGAFGIDEFHLDTFSSLNLHYDANEAHLLIVDVLRQFGGAFFPPGADFQYDLQLAVDAVPQQFDFSTDLETQFVYEASDPISSVTLAGTVDETDDTMANGFDIAFGMLGLPSEVRFGLIADEVPIVNGRLDLDGGGPGASDDGMLAGASIIDGRVDINGDGTVDAGDDGTYFGIPVINGELNVDGNGGVDGDDDGGLAGADLQMNGGVSQIGFLLRSVDNAVGIHDSPYKIIQALADEVPARFTLSYGAGRFLLETRDAGGNPDALEQIEALVSTTKVEAENNDKALPFTQDGPVQGGPILGDPGITGGDPGGSRINYSPFLQEIDERYYNGGVPDPAGVLTRLAELYADSEQLDLGEDHLLVRMEDVDPGGGDDAVGFASFEFNDFQRLSWTPDANGGQFVFRAPGRGDESFFAGYETDGEFTTLQIEHIPDEVIVDFDDSEHLVYTASASPGEIDFYQGPAGPDGLFAGDNANATRALMRNTPDSVRVFWDFGFPNGGAFMDASNEFEILFLTQDGSSRITAGLTLEDLHLEYGIEFLSFDVTKSIEIWNPFGDNLVIPIAWELFQAKAGIDNDADGLTLANLTDNDLNDIGGTGNPDVAGFFALYDDVSGPVAIDGAPAGSAPGAEEYVPVITVMEEGFTEFSIEFLVELDPTNPDSDIYPIDLELNVTLTGNLILDIWSSANTVFTDDDDIPFIPEVGFENPPDYKNNTPFHILPGIVPGNLAATIANGLAGIHVLHDWVITWDGFHTFDEHFDPFAGTPAPFTGSSGDGGFDAGDAGFIITTLGPFSGALSRWQAALAASTTYTDEQAADLINDIANNTTIVVGSFAGAKIGEASGNSTSATITIDPDAGGFAWFIDSSPFDDAEFGAGGPPPADLIATDAAAIGKVDMLTFFEHEIGHLLGLGHATTGVLDDTLPRSVRRIPVADDVDPGAPPTAAGPSDDVAALMVEVPPSAAPLASGDQAMAALAVAERSSTPRESPDLPAFALIEDREPKAVPADGLAVIDWTRRPDDSLHSPLDHPTLGSAGAWLLDFDNNLGLREEERKPNGKFRIAPPLELGSLLEGVRRAAELGVGRLDDGDVDADVLGTAREDEDPARVVGRERGVGADQHVRRDGPAQRRRLGVAGAQRDVILVSLLAETPPVDHQRQVAVEVHRAGGLAREAGAPLALE
jgi:hypothetical protein